MDEHRIIRNSAARVMLPAYAALFILIGLTYLLQQDSRTSSPAFDTVKEVMPIHWWGVVFLVIGILTALAQVLDDRRILVPCLVVGAAVVTFWTVALFLAAIENRYVSFTSSYWVLGMVIAQFASTMSLRRGAR